MILMLIWVYQEENMMSRARISGESKGELESSKVDWTRWILVSVGTVPGW